jgi:hypothetical protein
MSDDEFISAFESCTFPFAEWHHRAHVKIAYLYLRRYGLESATERLRHGIRAYNAANNVPDGPDRGYHETLTQFWLHVIHTTITQYGASGTADEFFDSHPQLSQKKNHRLFYSPGLFTSARAKVEFVPPDLAPLPSPVLPGET